MESATLVASAGFTMIPVSWQNLVAGNARDPDRTPDAGLDAKTVFHLNRRERDIVGVFEHCDFFRRRSKATLNFRGNPVRNGR